MIEDERTSAPTPQEKAQPGSAMQGEPVPVEDFELPEGLKRQPMGAYSKDKAELGARESF